MYLALIISQYLDILHQSQCSGVFFLVNDVMESGGVHKNYINLKFWAHLISVLVCGLREPLID